MSQKIQFYIYLNTRYVGILTQEVSGAASFQYSEEWIKTFPDYGISLSLPVQEAPYKGGEVLSYFDNLLPDNFSIRKAIAEKVKAKSEKTFDLLSAIGRDCVGALRFLSQKIELKELRVARGEELTDKEIKKVLENLKVSPLGIIKNEFRLSLAGAQEKTALLKMDNTWYRPLEETPTTHILKPAMGQLQNGIDLRTSVENEWLCLKLCEYFGLEVAKAEIENFSGKTCLVVERFDRLRLPGNKIARVAQEDFCQALKYSSIQKYESDGGPSILEIMELLNASLEREKDRFNFIKAQVIFWLMGATDGHAKNYSLFLRREGFFMTPFYDIMSMYPALISKQINLREMRLSFKVGKSRYDRLDKIRLKHFYEVAQGCHFPDKEMDKIIFNLKNKSLEEFEKRVKKPKGFNEEVWESIVSSTFKKLKLL